MGLSLALWCKLFKARSFSVHFYDIDQMYYPYLVLKQEVTEGWFVAKNLLPSLAVVF